MEFPNDSLDDLITRARRHQFSREALQTESPPSQKIRRSVPSRTVTKFMAAPRRVGGTSREHNAPRDVLRVNLNGCRDPISFRFFFCFFSHPDIRVLLHLPPSLSLRRVVRAPTRFPSYYTASRGPPSILPSFSSPIVKFCRASVKVRTIKLRSS